MFSSFICNIQPKTMKIDVSHVDWVEAMEVELSEFERNKIWRLISSPLNTSVVGLKLVFQKN